MSWQNSQFDCARQTDREVIDAFERAFEDSGFVPRQTTLVPKVGGSNFVFQFQQLDDQPEVQQLLDAEDNLFRQIQIHTDAGFLVRVIRQPNKPFDRADAQFQKSSLPENDENRAKFLAFHRALRDELRASDLKVEVREVIGEEMMEFYHHRDAQLRRLEQLASKLTREIAESDARLREEREAEFENRRQALETEVESRREDLEEKYQKRFDELEEREDELEKRLKEIDDRESRHARRKLRQDLKDELKELNEKFELTKGTQDLRSPVYWFTVVLLFLFGAGLVFYSYISFDLLAGGDTATTAAIVSTAIRQGLFGLAFASTAIFFIKWNNRWFERHADEEFRLKRLDLDFDRASWVVEMALEWSEENQEELPPELLERISAGLFTTFEEEAPQLHPADQLASKLMGSAAEVTLDLPGGGKLRLDKKGVRELQKPQ